MESSKRKRTRSTPPAFVAKTYMIVNDQSTDEVVSWNQDGFSFIVWNPSEFAQNILPKYFKHNNFANYLDELNKYGFRTISNDRWEFVNDLFQKDNHNLLYGIKKNKDTGILNLSASHPMVVDLQTANLSVSNPMVVHDLENTNWKLTHEVERLKKTIVELTTELKDEKTLNKNYHNPILLPQNYHVGETSDEIPMEITRHKPENDHVGETSDKIPMESEYEVNTVLFGIYIGGKKKIGEHVESKYYIGEKNIEEHENEVNPKLFGIYIGGKKMEEHENEVNPKLFGIYIGGKKIEEHVESKHYLENYGELKLHRGEGGTGKLYPF